jgi:hypothetical protein
LSGTRSLLVLNQYEDLSIGGDEDEKWSLPFLAHFSDPSREKSAFQ